MEGLEDIERAGSKCTQAAAYFGSPLSRMQNSFFVLFEIIYHSLKGSWRGESTSLYKDIFKPRTRECLERYCLVLADMHNTCVIARKLLEASENG